MFVRYYTTLYRAKVVIKEVGVYREIYVIVKRNVTVYVTN